MRLTELNPRWVTTVPGRTGMGIGLQCPICKNERIVVLFKNPLDGGSPADGYKFLWDRTGETFDTLTLRPSVDASGPGQIPCKNTPNRFEASHWHGWITNGEIA